MAQLEMRFNFLRYSLLFLPVIAWVTPAWARQECDTICQETLDYETNQLGIGTPREEAEQVVIGDPAPLPNGRNLIAVYPLDISIIVVGKLADAASEKTEATSSLEIIAGQRLENSLRFIPGLGQFRRSDARSANPTSQGVTLRGLGGNASSRALLTLDGVPQADPFGGWVAWPGYDALNLARVRVRRGGGQPSAGPGAIAGIIELDSLQRPGVYSASAAYGSRDSLDAKASGIIGLGQGHLSLSGSYARGDGFTPIREGQRGAVDRPAPYEQAGIALRAAVPLSAETELQFSARAFTDERDRGFDFSDNQNSGVDASLRAVDRDGDWQYSALGYVQLREFATRFGSISADRSMVTPVLDQFATPSTGLGARFELRPPVGDKAELRIGADWRRTVGETQEDFFFIGLIAGRNRNAGGKTDSYGGFAELTVQPSPAVTLTAGGRLDGWRIAQGFRTEINLPSGSTRSDDRFTDRSGTEWTGRLAAAFDVDDAVKLRGAAYSGWRLPTLNELYRPFRVGADATAANELLAPERVRGAEVGAEYDDGDFTLSITGFVNRLDDAIANVTLTRGPGNFPGVGFVAAAGTFSQRQNLEAIVSKGVEADAQFRVGDLNLRAGYAYVAAKQRALGSAAALAGLRPAQVPRHFAGAGGVYDDGKLKLSADLRYVGAQFEDDVNSQRLMDAFTVDAGLSYQLLTGLRAELRGENLFDAEVQAAISGSGVVERGTPRTIWLGLSVNFE